jgi:hypothetical protein
MNSFNDGNKNRVAEILSYIFQHRNDIPDHIQKRIINDMLWSATEDSNNGKSYKYTLPIWSKKAIDYYDEWLTNGHKNLRHEHLFPKRLLKQKLDQIPQDQINQNVVYQLLFHYSHAAVVTKKEDKILNENGFNQNIPNGYDIEGMNEIRVLFSRYIESNINLKFVDWRENNPFNGNNYYLINGTINYDFIRNELDFDGWPDSII